MTIRSSLIVNSFVFSLFLTTRLGFGEEQGGAAVFENVAAAMQKSVAAGEVAGIVTLIATDKTVVHLHAVGNADIYNKKPMMSDSIFWIASMSKPITGACIMMLQDEGKLSLDDAITKHLPTMSDLKMADGKSPVITIRHLLTHTSGMAELKADEAYTAKTLEEAASRYAKVPILFEPGSKWQYSQTSINTAARIVEVASGVPFDQFVQTRLCEPLGMRDTTFYLSDTQMTRLAKSYTKAKDGPLEETVIKLLSGKLPTDRNRFPAGNGGLFSTASDYARFCQMLLNGGQSNGKRILSEDAVKTMRTIATGDLVPGFTPGNGWGIACCVVREPNGVTAMLSPGTFGHGGAYGTQAWIDPVKHRVYILMIQRANLPNADGSDLRRVFQEEANKAFK